MEYVRARWRKICCALIVAIAFVFIWVQNSNTDNQLFTSVVDCVGKKVKYMPMKFPLPEVIFPLRDELNREIKEFHVFMNSCGDSSMHKLTLHAIRSIYETSTSIAKSHHRFHHADAHTRAHIHITHDDSIEVHAYLLHPLLEMLHVSNKVLSSSRMRITHSVTTMSEEMKYMFGKCAAARLTLPDDHPDINLAMYVDSDVLVNKDLRPLLKSTFARFNSSQWAGFAEESYSSPNWYTQKKSNIPFYKPYGLNSGVMVVSLNGWREALKRTKDMQDTTSWCLRNLQNCQLFDQDIINTYFEKHRDELYVLPCHWNYRDPVSMGCSADGSVANSTSSGTILEDMIIVHGNRRIFRSFRPGFAEDKRLEFGRPLKLLGYWHGYVSKYEYVKHD